MTTEAGWYVGVVVTRSRSSSDEQQPLYEESITLVRASTVEEATVAIRDIATQGLATYKNEAGDEITWEFEAIVEVKEVSEAPGHGVEVYSRFFRDYAAYRRFEPLLDGDID